MEVTVTPDPAPPPAPAPPHRGLSRRWVALVAVGVLLVAAAAVYELDARRRARDVTVYTPAVAGLRPLGDPVPFSDGAKFIAVDTWVVGDRAIAVGWTTGDTWIAGMDLS